MSENTQQIEQASKAEPRTKPMTFEELPRIVTENPDGTKMSTVDWSAVGLAMLTHNPETGDPWKLHRDNGHAVNGAEFLWVRDAQKALDAGLGEAIVASLNGTSWKVTQDDVNRSYDREVATKGSHGAKVRETLHHRLWNRLTGIRRSPEFRAPTVKIVEVTKIVMQLPNGLLFTPLGSDVESVAAELRSAWMDAMLQLGVPAATVPAMAQAQDFEAMLELAGWKPQENAK